MDLDAIRARAKDATFSRLGWAEFYAADVPALVAEVERLRARLTTLEGAVFWAGRLCGFEADEGLPCWCEMSERDGPHSERCRELRDALLGTLGGRDGE
jgi:hypothetical protein